MDNNEIMTVREVAGYLKVKEEAVNEWALKGEIPCVRFGSDWRFRRSEVDGWFDRKMNGRTQPETPLVDLAPLLPEERIFFLPGGGKEEVFDKLIQCLGSLEEVEDPAAFRGGIMRRESLMSTGIGLGVGVPHVRLDCVRNLVIAAAVCARPVEDYVGLDNAPVRMVFMIGAHTSQHTKYLRLLAYLSGKLRDNSFREHLLTLNTPAAFRKSLLNGGLVS